MKPEEDLNCRPVLMWLLLVWTSLNTAAGCFSPVGNSSVVIYCVEPVRTKSSCVTLPGVSLNCLQRHGEFWKCNNFKFYNPIKPHSILIKHKWKVMDISGRNVNLKLFFYEYLSCFKHLCRNHQHRSWYSILYSPTRESWKLWSLFSPSSLNGKNNLCDTKCFSCSLLVLQHFWQWHLSLTCAKSLWNTGSYFQHWDFLFFHSVSCSVFNKRHQCSHWSHHSGRQRWFAWFWG